MRVSKTWQQYSDFEILGRCQPPCAGTQTIAHTMRQEAAALRDFQLMSALGQSRLPNTTDEFVGCPLHLPPLPSFGTAAMGTLHVPARCVAVSSPRRHSQMIKIAFAVTAAAAVLMTAPL